MAALNLVRYVQQQLHRAQCNCGATPVLCTEYPVHTNSDYVVHDNQRYLARMITTLIRSGKMEHS